MWCLHTSAVESISSVSSVTGTYITAIGILTGSNGGTGISQTLIDICMHKDTHKNRGKIIIMNVTILCIKGLNLEK